MYAATSCTYKIENKAEGCSILFATSPACACPPSSPLHSAACCWGSSGSFQQSSRDSLGCQMLDVSGLHAGVFFLDRRGGLPMQQKKRREKSRTFSRNRNFYAHFWCIYFPCFCSYGWCDIRVDKAHIFIQRQHCMMVGCFV